MTPLHVVLVEPEIPQNTGNIARTCAATGTVLHLIRPYGFEISERTVRRAGLDYWQYLTLFEYDSLDDFFRRHAGEDSKFRFFSTKAKKIYSEVSYEKECYLFFGRETKGLPETLLRERYDRAVRLPMLPDRRSLNLSNSVAVAVYEALRQRGFEGFQTEGEIPQRGE